MSIGEAGERFQRTHSKMVEAEYSAGAAVSLVHKPGFTEKSHGQVLPQAHFFKVEIKIPACSD
jgi:hypothetical protein